MRDDIESKFHYYAIDRAVGENARMGASRGHFAATPDKTAPDLFGTLDILYAAEILGQLDGLTDRPGRAAWSDLILNFQGEDGWFRAGDEQSHSVEHVTAYALGGLLILSGGDGSHLATRLKPFRDLQAQLADSPRRGEQPFSLSLLDRVHFWRGSHRAGGLASIVGSASDLGLPAREFVGMDDPHAWLAGWWSYFASRIDSNTGYWALAPAWTRAAFDALYQLRHRPQLAAMGGAVHLYWISEKISAPMPHPEALIPATAALMEATGLYEKHPYCIDLDANFLIGRALSYLTPGNGLEETDRTALATNREAVLSWFASRPHQEWRRNSHALPGALAAVAEADRILLDDGADQPWRDIFKTTWWL